MYYLNRIELGRTVSTRLADLKGQEVVIIALKESAISACIGLASEINAWIYPMLTERVYISADTRIMGTINADGAFTWNPIFSRPDQEWLTMSFFGMLEEAKREAFSKLNRIMEGYSEFDKSMLIDRKLILAGDIIRDRLEIAAALQLLKDVRYEALYCAGGNVDANVFNEMRQITDRIEFLDVMTNMFNDDHYFEEQSAYTPEENKLLMLNIAQYWQ